MKKIMIVVLFLVGLTGCGNDVTLDEIDNYVNEIKVNAESAADDKEGYKDVIQEFNEYLKNADGKFEEYADAQIEANTLRLEGLNKDDNELISESSWKQAEALQILDELKESE